ncbi:hypothetical protein KOW79_021476 [Hemibagrus wyckioides]|uniref:Uncharacterized protein n=1 Tax=Hemibagrus wyckioides TaxID=337641 RepID=A0A9D3N5V4_9TELE|nr:hypothetical protein KOW79_021476 [Hemibagrus wyckioides]
MLGTKTITLETTLSPYPRVEQSTEGRKRKGTRPATSSAGTEDRQRSPHNREAERSRQILERQEKQSRVTTSSAGNKVRQRPPHEPGSGATSPQEQMQSDAHYN